MADYVIVGIFNGYYKFSANLVQIKSIQIKLQYNMCNDMLDSLEPSKSHSTARQHNSLNIISIRSVSFYQIYFSLYLNSQYGIAFPCRSTLRLWRSRRTAKTELTKTNLVNVSLYPLLPTLRRIQYPFDIFINLITIIKKSILRSRIIESYQRYLVLNYSSIYLRARTSYRVDKL